jgi:regulator of protease activity HflC (stomatin/prohibitin superfamily)
MAEIAALIAAVVVVVLMFTFVVKTVRIVPQARARNIERFGRYRKTLEPGMNFIIPFVDRVKPLIDLREQVVAFKGQPVITEDNLVVHIDTVLFFQVTDPRGRLRDRQLHPGDRADHRDHAAQCDREHGPRGDPDVA